MAALERRSLRQIKAAAGETDLAYPCEASPSKNSQPLHRLCKQLADGGSLKTDYETMTSLVQIVEAVNVVDLIEILKTPARHGAATTRGSHEQPRGKGFFDWSLA